MIVVYLYMKSMYILLLGTWLTCGVKSTEVFIPTKDSTDHSKDTVSLQNDTSLLNFSNSVLSSIKESGHKSLGKFIHPDLGIRFSPYGYIDTINDLHFTLESYEKEVKMNGGNYKKKWGYFDGSGEPINLSYIEYFKRFVYDVDFINAPEISINEFKSGGNSQNNLTTIYENCEFVEYYFPGIDPKYDGMDWRTLRLVFKKSNGSYYLTGVIHDQWTI